MGSIPLPALDIKTNEQSPLAQYAQLQQIRNAQTGQQTAQLQQAGIEQENQQRGLALEDQKTLRSLAPQHVQKDADGNVTGFDTEGLLKDAAGKGVSPQTINTMRMNYADTVSKLASADKSVRDNEQAKNKAMYETLESVREIKDPQQRQAALIKSLPTLLKQGVDVSGIKTDQPISDDMLNFDESGLGMHSQMLADAKTAADVAKTKQETTTSAATQAHTEMETTQGGPPPVRELNSWLAAHPGKSAADYEEYMKKIVPAYNFNLSGGATGGLTKDAIDQQAEKYFQTGQLPPSGRGPAGVMLGRTIMQRANDLHPSASLAEGSAEFSANKSSLAKLQSSLDQVSAFENTANKNLDMFTSLAHKAINTGIPLLNAPLRTGAKLLAGNEDQLALDAARQVAVNEIAKVTSNPGLSGQLSDAARKEVDAFIPANATYGQALRVAGVLKQDMANRHESYQEQISDIQKRLGGKQSGGGGGSAATKTLTSAQIAQAAKDHNVSVEEATRQATAAGYKVQP